MHKAVRQLIEKLEQQPGVEVDKSSDHPRVYKDTVFVMSLPATPSSPRWYQNALATLKRGGVDVHAPLDKKEVAPVATVPHYNPPRLEAYEPQPVEIVPVMEQTSPALTHAVPESQFPASQHMPPTQRLRTEQKPGQGRRQLVVLEDRRWLRGEVLAFIEQLNPLVPSTTGRAQFLRYVLRFSETYKGWSPKNRSSLEQSLYALIRFDEASLPFAQLLVDAMEAFDVEEHMKAEEKNAKQLKKKRVKTALENFSPKVKQKKVETLVETVPSSRVEQLWKRADAAAREAQKMVGSNSTEKIPYGRGSFGLFAKEVIRQAKHEGITLTPSVRAKKVDKTTVRSRIAGVLRRDPNMLNWMLDECELYVDLWERAMDKQVDTHEPVEMQVTAVVSGTVIANIDQLLDMISNRPLTRAQIIEAIELSNKLAQFEAQASA